METNDHGHYDFFLHNIFLNIRSKQKRTFLKLFLTSLLLASEQPSEIEEWIQCWIEITDLMKYPWKLPLICWVFKKNYLAGWDRWVFCVLRHLMCTVFYDQRVIVHPKTCHFLSLAWLLNVSFLQHIIKYVDYIYAWSQYTRVIVHPKACTGYAVGWDRLFTTNPHSVALTASAQCTLLRETCTIARVHSWVQTLNTTPYGWLSLFSF